MSTVFHRVYLSARPKPAQFLMLLMLMPLSLYTHAEFRDPLDWPAHEITRLAERPTQAVAKAGEIMVAVGAQGLIATSTDGNQWTQSPSPVQSDLLALHFPTPEKGWIVGHDGVILHSKDAGVSWEKQLDGRLAGERFTEHYAGLQIEPEALEAAQSAISLNYAAGPALPLLDVWFADAERGFVVGSFGTLAVTSDGGETWEPWLHRIDNEELLNLNAIQGVGDAVYIAAERGVVFKLEPQTQRFEKIETGYDGSFFGLLGVGDSIIAYGLSGAAYRSDDEGLNWMPLEGPSSISLTAGATLSDEGDFVLVNARGDMLFGNAATDVLQLKSGKGYARYTGVISLDGKRLLITSLEGIRSEAVQTLSVRR
ncbi:WD40/YVTN/BNR-like repeat-containing protein [Pseudomonas saliphila]|uniref:WD40/YVTN/BNR-like repeat-containing protein n=1 Tax=Pseudomonas saliphila TaxID=2586906 RepID=UPI0015B727CC|nr:YCF48-related protein [Pseudomonas saliphila]